MTVSHADMGAFDEPIIPPTLYRISDLITGSCTLMGRPARDKLTQELRRAKRLSLMREEVLPEDHPAYASIYGVTNPDVHHQSKQTFKQMLEWSEKQATS